MLHVNMYYISNFIDIHNCGVVMIEWSLSECNDGLLRGYDGLLRGYDGLLSGYDGLLSGC